jgi:DNA-nicking Smr family endonuclease
VFGAGDPKADRKAAKGRIPIEARLDLHGMSEVVAQTRVTRFILGARDDGLRLVLVITGKGARAGGEGRGIIRTRFIDWVEASPLRAAIARVAPAKPKDGGAGAFYVFLKRKTRR